MKAGKKFTCLKSEEERIEGAVEGSKNVVLNWMKKTYPGIRRSTGIMTAFEFFHKGEAEAYKTLDGKTIYLAEISDNEYNVKEDNEYNVKEDNEYNVKEDTKIPLFREAVKKLDPTWHDRYVDICEKVKAVDDWRDPNDASDALIERLVYDIDNGVASAGQAFSAWPTPRPDAGKYRDLLAQLKNGLNSRFPSDEVAKCRDMYKRLTKGKGASSIFNRIVSAFLPGKVSPVMFESDFDDACDKLVQGGYIKAVQERIGDDPWHSKNVQLMDQLRELLPDGHVKGAAMDIDDYSRGMFVWGVHANVDMFDWMLLRAPLDL